MINEIKEVDRTTAAIGEYQNFAVVVPGFVGENADESVFDDNDIYECSLQSDFVTNVGIVKPNTVPTEAVAPILENFAGEGAELPEYFTTLSAIDFFVTYAGQVYSCTPWSSQGRATPTDGYLKDATLGTFKLVDNEDWDAADKYCVILAGNEGRDAKEISNQIGNQIAYELLGMGYPILYKKLEDEADLSKASFWEALKDRATYDFRFVINGLLADNKAANQAIEALAEYQNGKDPSETGRGDCVALCDIDEDVYSTTEAKTSRSKLFTAIAGEVNDCSGLFNEGKYAAFFAPSVCLLGVDDEYENHKFPASFYYLACFKWALDHGFAEWYAIAGYTRGVCKYIIESTDVNFGDYLINALEPRTNPDNTLNAAVNVIAKIRSNYYLWGNRTAAKLTAKGLIASHFLNIRQLCSSLKKQIYVACRRFTFDPNSDVLWINFCNAIKPILEKMKADQGLKDYAIEKLAGRKAELKARIRIIPIEAVEDFDIEISLEDNFGETTATAVEK